MWQNLFHCCKKCDGDSSVLSLPILSPLVYQTVTQQLYINLINCHLGATLQTNCYVAVYVPYKLMIVYERSTSNEIVNVVECLSGMAVNGGESGLLAYTSKWMDLVKRGGALEDNDIAFVFFREVEVRIQKKLTLSFNRVLIVEDQRDVIISAVAEDETVQFYWTILSVDIDREDLAVKLLKEMIGLWLDIRGFSIANAWLEKYKNTIMSKKDF